MDIFGYSELKQTQRFEEGRIILGGICTKYDGEGKVVSVVIEDTFSVGYDNKPMSEKEALRLMYGR